MTTTTKELVPQPIGHLANIPDHLKAFVGQRLGSENVEQDDLLIPRLCVAQSLSPQLKKSNEAYIPGLQLGDIFNSVTGEVYGNDEVTVIPLFFFKNYITFKKGGGVEAMYAHANDVPRGELNFSTVNGESVPPKTTEFKNRMCLIVRPNERPSPIVVSFKSSGIKAAKKWNSLINSTNLPAFARTYKLVVAEKQDGQNSWYVFNVLPDIFVPADFFNQAKEYFDQLSAGGYKVDTSGLDTEEREAGSDDGPGF
jgi:hypothetical protein